MKAEALARDLDLVGFRWAEGAYIVLDQAAASASACPFAGDRVEASRGSLVEACNLASGRAHIRPPDLEASSSIVAAAAADTVHSTGPADRKASGAGRIERAWPVRVFPKEASQLADGLGRHTAAVASSMVAAVAERKPKPEPCVQAIDLRKAAPVPRLMAPAATKPQATRCP